MRPSRIHHVGLPVSDLDISVAWYREALGLTHEAAAGVPSPLPGTGRSRRYAPASPTSPGQSWGCRLHGRADGRAARAACSGSPSARVHLGNVNAYLQALRETGAMGLEPATSGVTGLFHGYDDWRRLTRNRSIDAALGPSAPSSRRIQQS
jgi:catechol 2,3-dioxygenase-like lactoylglutathione lyase family enzyme